MEVINRVVAVHRHDEVTRRKVRALVQQLVERVLAIGTYATPNHRAGVVIYFATINGHAFAVTFHVELLQVSRQRAQVVVVWQDGVGVHTKEVNVPDTQQSHNDGHVVFERGRAEMLIHQVGAA